MLFPVPELPIVTNEPKYSRLHLVFNATEGVLLVECAPNDPALHRKGVMLAHGLKRTNGLRRFLSNPLLQGALSELCCEVSMRQGADFNQRTPRANVLVSGLRSSLYPWCLPSPPEGKYDVWTSYGAFGTPPVEFHVPPLEDGGVGGPNTSELQALVGGYVEAVALSNGKTLLVDEEAAASWQQVRPEVNPRLNKAVTGLTWGNQYRGTGLVTGVMARSNPADPTVRPFEHDDALEDLEEGPNGGKVAVEWVDRQGATQVAVTTSLTAAHDLRDGLRKLGYPATVEVSRVPSWATGTPAARRRR